MPSQEHISLLPFRTARVADGIRCANRVFRKLLERTCGKAVLRAYSGHLYRFRLPSYTSRVNTNPDPRQEQDTLQSASLSPEPIAAPVGRWRVFAFAAAGVLLAMLFVGTRTARAAWQEIAQLLSLHGKPEPASANVLSEHEIEGLDGMPPQSQAELLLERSINHYRGANDQIAARVESWRGKIKARLESASVPKS